MLTTWFASKERGTYWGLWNIAHNLGGFLAPIIAGAAAAALGWRWGMYVPGIMALAMGAYVLFATGDAPEDEGFEAVEVLEEKPDESAGDDAGALHSCCLRYAAACGAPRTALAALGGAPLLLERAAFAVPRMAPSALKLVTMTGYVLRPPLSASEPPFVL